MWTTHYCLRKRPHTKMPNAQSNPIWSKRLSSFSSPKPPQHQGYIPNNRSRMAMELQEKAAAPLEIGTRGTVGSLIMQEIRYFKSTEVTTQDISERRRASNMASSSYLSKPMVELALTPKKKKKRISRRLLPSICTLVEVSDNRPIGISPGLSYRALKSDMPARSPA